MAPNVYGAAHFRKSASPGNQFTFLQQFRANGGKFFDARHEGAARLAAGVKTLEQMIAANKASIPGNNELDAVALWVAWLQGKVAMIFSWPPTGRMSANYAQRDKAINFVPQSTIAGKVGYAVMPGSNGEHGVRLCAGARRRLQQRGGRLSVHAVGRRRRRCRWCACMLPYALRDPYRLSHYKSELYRRCGRAPRTIWSISANPPTAACST